MVACSQRYIKVVGEDIIDSILFIKKLACCSTSINVLRCFINPRQKVNRTARQTIAVMLSGLRNRAILPLAVGVSTLALVTSTTPPTKTNCGKVKDQEDGNNNNNNAPVQLQRVRVNPIIFSNPLDTLLELEYIIAETV